MSYMYAMRQSATIRYSTTDIAASALLPVVPGGGFRRYAYLTSNTSSPQMYKVGDSTVDATTTPHGAVVRAAPGHLINIVGLTHISVIRSTGNGAIYCALMEISMLPAPPQIVNSIKVSSAADGPATAIPLLPDGSTPKYVMVSATETSACSISFGDSTIADGTTTAWSSVNVGMGQVIFNVAGMTHFDWGGTNGDIIVAALGF